MLERAGVAQGRRVLAKTVPEGLEKRRATADISVERVAAPNEFMKGFFPIYNSVYPLTPTVGVSLFPVKVFSQMRWSRRF